MENNRFITVGSLNRYLKAKTDKDIHLQRLFLKGEIKDFKLSGANIYFTLLDEDASIRCMMFSNYQYHLKFMPQDGDVVIAEGTLSFYVKSGNYTFITQQMMRYGEGDLHQAFLALKDKLDKEGLFNIELKKPLPAVIKHIGIVTSPTGDAIHDIISTINRRFPFMDATLYPCKVQGADCPKSVMSALFKAYDNKNLDVIIIARGGGSDEDLNGFNDEMLARTIRLSPIPVISGVGHEADITICDLVSDLRAPTPTGAAMLITPNKDDIIQLLEQAQFRLKQGLEKVISQYNYRLKQHELSLVRYNPTYQLDAKLHRCNELKTRLKCLSFIKDFTLRIKQDKERLNNALDFTGYTYLIDEKKYRLNQAINSIITHYEQCLNVCKIKTEAISPLNILDKGYVLIKQNDHIVSHINLLNQDNLDIVFKDGVAHIDVKDIKKDLNK